MAGSCIRSNTSIERGFVRRFKRLRLPPGELVYQPQIKLSEIVIYTFFAVYSISKL
jgi:hypothetical protein